MTELLSLKVYMSILTERFCDKEVIFNYSAGSSANTVFDVCRNTKFLITIQLELSVNKLIHGLG